MKKTLAAILCAMLIAVALFGLIAKYDTYGVIPGTLTESFGERVSDVRTHIERVSNGKVLFSEITPIKAGYFLFSNRFGRTVVVEEAGHWKKENVPLYQTLEEKFDRVILSVRTFSAAIPSHLDFLGITVGISTVYDVVAKCGMPNGGWAGDVWDLKYVTQDGYVYNIGFDSRDAITTVSKISIKYMGSDGYYKSVDLETFQWTVRLIYLGIAAILSVVLVLLIKIPNTIRKRKALPQTD